MKIRWHWLWVVAFVILAGCSELKENDRLGCCNPDAAADGTCELIGAEDVAVLDTIACSDEAASCQVSVRIYDTLPDGSIDTEGRERMVKIPYCSQIEALACVNSACTVQVCGGFNYQPEKVISWRDTQELQQEFEQGREDVPTAEEEVHTQNLYRTTCLELPMDENLSTVFSNAEGSFINTFRFGVGDSFNTFERYRNLFPYTDAQCNINNLPNARDRFANYFKQQADDINGILERIDGLTYCPDIAEPPFSTDLYGPAGFPPNYKFETVRRYAQQGEDDPSTALAYALGGGNADPDTLRLETQEFDRNFYDQMLRWIYRGELNRDYSLDEPVPAPFECRSGIDCQSAQCNFDTYQRGMCQRNNGAWVDCECNGLECAGETEWNALPSDVLVLSDETFGLGAIQRYEEGGEMYLRTPRKVEFYYHTFDGDRVGWNKIWYCQQDGCYLAMESPNFGSPIDEARPDRQEGNDIVTAPADLLWDADQFKEANLECSVDVDGRTICNPVDNERSTFRMYPSGQTIEPSLAVQNPYSLECNAAGTACDYQRDLSGVEPIDYLAPGRGDQVRAAFPNGIYFFGSKQVVAGQTHYIDEEGNGGGPLWPAALEGREYIGYTLLPPEEFAKTNFYQACQLDENDYNVLEITPRLAWGERASGLGSDVGSVYPGRVWFSRGGYRGYQRLDNLATQSSTLPLVQGKGFVIQSVNKGAVGEYWYSRYVIYIKNAGSCKTENDRPVVKAFGWCESCTYATLAQQEVTPGEEYNYLTETQHRTADAPAYSREALCYPGFFGLGQFCWLNKEEGVGEFPNGLLESAPETQYLREKQVKYLKEGVLPVLDISDDSNWNEVDLGAVIAANTYVSAARAGIAGLDGRVDDLLRETDDPVYERMTDDMQTSMHKADAGLVSTREGLNGMIAQLAVGEEEQAMVTLADTLPYFVSAENNFTQGETRIGGLCAQVYQYYEDYRPLIDLGFEDPSAFTENAKELCDAVKEIRNDIDESHLRLIGELQKIEEAIITDGPTILVVDRIDANVDETDIALLKLRTVLAKSICGKCQIAVEVDNGPPGRLQGRERMGKNLVAVGAIRAQDPEGLQGIDIIAIPLYPQEYAKENPDWCAGDGSALYEQIFYDLNGFGREMLNRPFQKLTLVNRMEIDTRVEPDCWRNVGRANTNQDPVYRLTAALIMRQRTLTENGIMGILYSDAASLVTATDTGKTHSPLFCSLEEASRLMVSKPPLTIYSQVPLQEEVLCQKCTALEISEGQCTRTCGNGNTCTMPDDVPRRERDYYRCPPTGYPEPSIPCASVPEDVLVSCRQQYGDGSLSEFTVQMNQLDSGFPDVIASLPEPYRCDVTDGSGTYTYTKVDINGKSTAPLIFTYENDPLQDCGVPDYAAQMPTQCGGTTLPVRNYQLECDFVGGPPNPWPPVPGNGPGGRRGG